MTKPKLFKRSWNDHLWRGAQSSAVRLSLGRRIRRIWTSLVLIDTAEGFMVRTGRGCYTLIPSLSTRADPPAANDRS